MGANNLLFNYSHGCKSYATIHIVNFCSEMGQAKHVSGKNILCSMNVYKSRGKRIFEIIHWPFELPPNQHRPTDPFDWPKWCSLARTMYKFKNSFFPNFLLIHRAKYIFSRDVFFLYHFRAKIHGMIQSIYSTKLHLCEEKANFSTFPVF